METSLRLGSSESSKALRIHAKESFPFDSNTFLQVHGELDTKNGAPNYVSAMIRHFYPHLSASLGVGLRYNKRMELAYTVRAKKAFSLTEDGFLTFNLKGRCDVDNEFKQWKSTGAVELGWSIFNVRRDQDVRLKFGYEVVDKVPYMQIRENNWALNTYENGRWSVRFDL